jgi:hypothetical protein
LEKKVLSYDLDVHHIYKKSKIILLDNKILFYILIYVIKIYILYYLIKRNINKICQYKNNYFFIH